MHRLNFFSWHHLLTEKSLRLNETPGECYMFVSIPFHGSGFCYFTDFFLLSQREKRNAKLLK